LYPLAPIVRLKKVDLEIIQIDVEISSSREFSVRMLDDPHIPAHQNQRSSSIHLSIKP
jgi:hypothetical protein